MTALANAAPSICPPPSAASALRLPALTREGVSWTGGVGGKPLRVHLAVANPHDRPTTPVRAGIQIADFGVFRPWAALTQIVVPPIPPGGSLVMTGTADGDGQRRRIRSLATPDVPMARDLAVAAHRSSVESLLARHQRRLLRLMLGRAAEVEREGLLGKPMHFVGNLNVFVNPRQPVERHMSMRVGIRPGHVNASAFFVGGGELDAYTFEVQVCEPGWDVRLSGVALGHPVTMTQGVMHARIVPPERAESGRIAIAVHQESTDTTGLVEFELETTRLGSKCYFFG